MLNFLGKLRRNTPHPGGPTAAAGRDKGMGSPTSRYLKYAFGEIMLVVIGILIAVQINNYNESLKNEKEESFYLLKLRENLQEDLRNIEIKKAQAQRIVSEIETIISESRSPEVDSFSINLTESMIGLAGMVSQTATWENLKSTGKLSIIQNQVLTDSIYKLLQFLLQ